MPVMQSPIEVFARHLLNRTMTAEHILREAEDNSGDIDLDEFIDLCGHILHLPLSTEEITSVFQFVDTDKSGTTTTLKLKEAIAVAMASVSAKLVSEVANFDEGDVRQDTKLVALVAHNNMKPSMLAFVAKHRDFFKTVQIVTTGNTGTALEKKLGLTIARKVASGPLGGDQEIGGMIATDDVAATFFFIDPLSCHPHEADIRALTRICEVHNTCCATNPNTGDALVHALTTNRFHIDLLYLRHARAESDVVAKFKKGQQARRMSTSF